MRLAMILPGLGRVQRGAETAFLELARHLSELPGCRVTVFGSGTDGTDGLDARPVPVLARERFEGWPRLPALRNETQYEELSFALGLAASGAYRPADYDAVITCTYPHVNWLVNARRGRRPAHVFVTQNGDWPCRRLNREFRYFRCDGLVCTNPEYFDRHRAEYRSALIPNGVDPTVYTPARSRPRVGPPVVLMVSALSPSKRVPDGVRAVAGVPGARLVLAGDGPQRAEVTALAAELLPGRHTLLGSVPRAAMPDVYGSADALLHMSRDEPFGIVYLEAAAAGLAQVVHDSPTTRWILGDAALFADTADVPAVSAALRSALSPEVRPALGDAGRRRVVAGWTWARQAAEYHRFIRDLLAERARPRAGRPASATTTVTTR